VTDIIPPNIVDVNGTPTSGDNFILQFNITDNIEVQRSIIKYWFDQHADMGSYNIIDSINISIPIQATILHYSVTASDRKGNVQTHEGSKEILDNLQPTIGDISGIPQTGREYELRFNIQDNRGISYAKVVYWSKDIRKLSDLTYVLGYYHCYLIVPTDSIELNYTVTAWDFHGNAGVLNGSLKVKDTLSPIITDRSKETANKGDKVTFKASVVDNVNVKTVYIYYWTDGSGEKIDMVRKGDVYSARIWVPDNCHNFTYIIYSQDGAGNLRQTSPKTLILHNNRNSIDINWMIGIVICVIAMLSVIIYYRRRRR
jgi:hypothetical protein